MSEHTKNDSIRDAAQKKPVRANSAVPKARRPLLALVGLGLALILWTAMDFFQAQFGDKQGLIVHGGPQNTTGTATASPAGMPGTPSQNAVQDPALSGIMRLMQQLQKNPNDLTALMGLTEHFTHTEDWARAETFALRAMVAAPMESRPLYLLGVIQHSQGRHIEAAASLEKALALKDDPITRYSLAVLYIHYLNNLTTGKTLLQQALNHPESSASLKEHLQTELNALEKGSDAERP